METTLYIRMDILKKIQCAAQLKNISCSKMIAILLRQVMGSIQNPWPVGILVRYQQRRKPEEWYTLHVQLIEDDYEFVQDMRRLLKLSVSLMLAIAAKKYLTKLIKGKVIDNYPFLKNYFVGKEAIDNIMYWRFTWCYPANAT